MIDQKAYEEIKNAAIALIRKKYAKHLGNVTIYSHEIMSMLNFKYHLEDIHVVMHDLKRMNIKNLLKKPSSNKHKN